MGTVIDPVYQYILADGITDTTLADITGLVTAKIQPRLSRPMTTIFDATEANDPVWFTTAPDGYPNLSPGDRTIKVYRNGALISNCEVWRCDWVGDANTQTVQITCYDPMIRAPMHLVRDDYGNYDGWQFINPVDYATGGDATHPKLPAGPTVQRIIRNADTFDDHGIGDEPNIQPPWYTGPRQFPIDYNAGDFSAQANIWDLFSNGPIDCGTFIYGMVSDTGVCDIVLTPTEPALGTATGVYGILNVVNQWGADNSAAVHFDYNTGNNSIVKVERSIDMATVANRLKYLLGPKSNRPDHWPGSIDQPILADQITQVQPTWDEMWLSRERYGLMYAVRTYDSEPTNTVRWLFHALFNTELALRVGPRELIALVPSTECPFKPWDHYDIGDIVAVNLAQTVGPATLGDPRAMQRIYGFDVEVDVNGVETVTTIYNSADAVNSSVAPA